MNESECICAVASYGRAVHSAPSIVFSHSLGADRTMWTPQLSALADEFHLLAVDTRGHGQSRVPPGPYSLAQLGQDVLDAADTLGIARFHFCGISLGGLTGLWLGTYAPSRLLSLAACNTAARIGSLESWSARIAVVRAEGMPRLSDSVVPRWFATDFPTREPALFGAVAETFSRTSPEGYSRCCEALAAADLRDDVTRIKVPTWVVGGELDLSTPPAQARWLHTQIEGSSLTVFDGASHLSNLDVAPAFTEQLRAFVRSH